MAETEYVAGGKVQAGIYPKGCVYTNNPGETNLKAAIGKRLEYFQEYFELGKGVKNPCWKCGYNKSRRGICEVSRARFKENGKEFLIQPKVENPVLT